MFKDILGQERAKKILKNSLIKGTISHAYLFSGHEEVGKRLTALTFAKALNCQGETEDSCDGCQSCKKIDNFNHPDLSIIKPENEDIKTGTISELRQDKGSTAGNKASKSIKIETIKELQRRLSFKPYEGKKKVVIIDGADNMTNEAANAFLKTLEEPPGETVIILITSNFHMLLPTVVSRCQIIKFSPLSAENLKEILVKKYSLGEKDALILSSLSKGRLGRAIAMDYATVCKSREEALKLVTASIKGDNEYIFTESKKISKREKEAEELAEFLDIITDILRDAAIIKGTGSDEHIINKDIKDKLIEFSGKLNILFIINMVDAVQRTKHLLKSNANQQLAVEAMMIGMSGGLNGK